MKKGLMFKQTKPLTVTILGVTILILSLIVTVTAEAELSQIVVMILFGLVLLGYSFSYEIRNDGPNKMHFKLFGATLFKQNMGWNSPDYITVFSTSFKQNADWGPVSALGKQTGSSSFVIRFFKGKEHLTIWKTGSLNLAKAKAIQLGELLDVEVM